MRAMLPFGLICSKEHNERTKTNQQCEQQLHEHPLCKQRLNLMF
jgi:hypothetical protein